MIIHVFLKTQSGPVCLDSFLQEVYKLVGPSKNQNKMPKCQCNKFTHTGVLS